ncbi:MAG: hypothetical protein QF510_09355, partial [Rhodospirillales bacterium]|nr:hypothetical protein [Rhodospirillales bacterium]
MSPIDRHVNGPDAQFIDGRDTGAGRYGSFDPAKVVSPNGIEQPLRCRRDVLSQGGYGQTSRQRHRQKIDPEPPTAAHPKLSNERELHCRFPVVRRLSNVASSIRYVQNPRDP